MTAVTANQLIVRQDGHKQKAPAAAVYLYQGTMAFTNATGYADDDTASGANEFAGIVIGAVDNSGGSAGDLDVELWKSGVFELSGTGFAQTDVGTAAKAIDNNTIVPASDEATAGVVIGEIVEYVSTTKVRVKIDVGGGTGLIQTITDTVAFGDFTDNTDTTGYVDLGTALPAGALVLGVKYVVATGFTGDTTAVVQTGVAGDLDRFSAVTTASVLAAATVGHGVSSTVGNGLNAASTIRVTVTGAADFTSISAGSMTVTVSYILL